MEEPPVIKASLKDFDDLVKQGGEKIRRAGVI